MSKTRPGVPEIQNFEAQKSNLNDIDAGFHRSHEVLSYVKLKKLQVVECECESEHVLAFKLGQKRRSNTSLNKWTMKQRCQIKPNRFQFLFL